MHSPRILFVYQYLTLGGVEAVILARMNQLLRMGADCRALFFSDLGGRAMFGPLRDRIAIEDRVEAQLRLLEEYRPSHIISFDTPQILPHLAALEHRPQVIYEVHTIYPEYMEPLRDRQLMAPVDRYFVPSTYQRAVIEDYLPRDAVIHVVPNSLARIFLEPPPIPKATHPPIIVWVGRLDEVKNWRAFLRIAEGLHREAHDVRMWLVGGLKSSPQQQAQLWEEIRSRSLQHALVWIPAVEHRQIPALYRYVVATHGCLVSTSRTESFGVAILEAMACELPVVVPRAGALVDMVQDGETGFLYAPDDERAAVEATMRLISEPGIGQHIGSAAAQFARQFTPERAIETFLEASGIS